MADSSRFAGGAVLLIAAAVAAVGWVVTRPGQEPEGATVPTTVLEASAPAPPAEASRMAVPMMPADAEPDSVAGRIADLQAELRDEQGAQLAEATRLGQEVQAEREYIAELQRDLAALEEGKLARLDARQGRQDDRCDPTEPDSRACKRQAALQGKLQDAEAGVAGLQEQIVAAQAGVEALLAQRTAALRAVDELEERLRSDPELIRLYAQLAQEP